MSVPPLRLAAATASPPDRAELISRSHERSTAFGLQSNMVPDFSAAGRGELNNVREKNESLHRHAMPIMEMLYEQIVDTHSMVVLTDACGTILHSVGDRDFLARAAKVALTPGVNWAEQAKGTNAIGTALIEERPILVHAHEHYLSANHFLTCSASPIFDPRGDLLGVLDVTGDHRSYNQHTMALVKMSARMIENHWFSDSHRNQLLLRFHTRSEFIGTLAEGILSLAPDGRILGANRAAVELTGLSAVTLKMSSLALLLGTSVDALYDHLRVRGPQPMQLQRATGERIFAVPQIVGHDLKMSHLRAVQPAPAANPPRDEAAAPAPAQGRGQPQAAARGDALDLTELDSGDTQMHGVIERVRRVLDRDIPVLILGETGTGKDMLARALHRASSRRHAPFVAVNCASIPETLIESELFGYEDGAFTGARRKGATGKIVQAHGGTLFLDEIGDMPLALQARLLRVLQERQVVPLQASRAIDVDIAVVCATHRNLRQMMDEGAFRHDLYYRLNGLSVRLPALRERSDRAALTRRLLAQFAPGRNLVLSDELRRCVDTYAWPGNVRQLANVLRTACVMASQQGTIGLEHLPEDFIDDWRAGSPSRTDAPAAIATSLARPQAAANAVPQQDLPEFAADGSSGTLSEIEERLMRDALDRAGGNISEAARQLRVSRNTIYRRLRWRAQ